MIKAFLDKYYPKQFKVRLSAWGYSYPHHYDIQYAYYRFWPTWWNICTWDSIMEWHGIFTTDSNYKSRFKSIEDIHKHYEYWEAKEENYYKNKNRAYSESKKHDGKILN